MDGNWSYYVPQVCATFRDKLAFSKHFVFTSQKAHNRNIKTFRHSYIVRMHMLCKYYFVRIVFDLFVGPFNCLNFSLELCVCGWVGGCARVRACVCACVRVFVRACMRECMCVCLLLSLLFFLPNIVLSFFNVYKLFLLKTI